MRNTARRRGWLILVGLLTLAAWASLFGPATPLGIWLPLALLGAGVMAAAIYVFQQPREHGEEPTRKLPPRYLTLIALTPLGIAAVLMGTLLNWRWLAQVGFLVIAIGLMLKQFLLWSEKDWPEKAVSILLGGCIVAFILSIWVGPWLMWLSVWVFGGLIVANVVQMLLPKHRGRGSAR